MSLRLRSLLRNLPAALLTTLLTACGNLGYYTQAVRGHLAVMQAAVPIEAILDDPAGDPGLKAKLAEVRAMRDFASRELGLPDNGNYRSYADLGRPYVVWNVFAAREFSLQLERWCVPVVGCAGYRGYYDRNEAADFAASLRAAGYDTHVGGVVAYSTLGHFADPVLNTFLRLGPLDVARTVFHELAHQVVFVPGDSLFNESFATTVEEVGMQRWLAQRASPEQTAAFTTQRARQAAFGALLEEYRARLRTLYASANDDDHRRQSKAALFAALRRDYAELKAGWGGYAGYDAFFGDDLNNARLASLSLYNALVPAFELLLAGQDFDLPRFYERVSGLAALEHAARHDALRQILAGHGGAAPAVAATAAYADSR
ncbi:aminopeptidase [Accumulibacter sp.]|uniref:aminopeptidase n=1 Tax=Accumulibacter sp. TaxID=2053492 RepID=UPI002639C21C|nr:aminopeptidase [Accumulibacter sp.]